MRRSTRQKLSTVTAAALVTGLAVVAPTTAGSAATGPVVFDDMEHGNPGGSGWFSFNSDTAGGGIDANGTDLPPADGGAYSLQTGWGGASGFYGGFGRTNPTDLSGTDHFSFWINPDAGQQYTLEINLQDDDNRDNAIDTTNDDEFQFTCVVSGAGPCAVSGGGWQLVSIPLTDFDDDGSYLTGGNGVLDAAADSNGGNGQLINVVVAVIGDGNPASFRTDYWVFSDGPRTNSPSAVIDDFESGIAPGSACDGIPLGFCTFNDTNSSVSLANPTTPPVPPLPGSGTPNSVLQMELNVTAFAGFIHGFTNAAGDQWTPQDWSTREGISFWMYGKESGSPMFIDILENRNPGSTKDDAERWSVPFVDDFLGWKQLEFPFADFTRKEIGNGAPNDGFDRFEVHGYAIGAVAGEETYYFDNVTLYGVGEPPPVAVNLADAITSITEGKTGDVRVKLNRALGPDDPDEVSIKYATERSNAVPDRDFAETSGTLTFVKGESTEQAFQVTTFDNSKFAGDKQVVIRLTDPVGMDRGSLFQGSVMIRDDEKFDRRLLDDFEQGAYLWSADPDMRITTPTVKSGAALARPDQDEVETIMEVATPLVVDFDVMGSTCRSSTGVIPVHVLSTPDFDATLIDHTTVRFGKAAETHTSGKKRTPTRHEEDVNGDGLMDLVFHFRANQTGYDCTSTDLALTGKLKDGTKIVANGAPVGFGRDFPLGQDWSKGAGLSFWYYGTGTGDDVTVTLKDNRAPEPGRTGWKQVWSDEFDGPEGTTPDPSKWAYEIGDTTPDGKNGWGNEERQYYTDDPKNARTDGDGNLVITLDKADGSQECYYGPCEYESARLVTQNKAEFAYGRIESKLKVPSGGKGLWPAFWSLGTDITHNPWPNSGEIDVMEYVSRVPNEIFGTIHGPGYAGGASFGGTYDFGRPVKEAYHTYAVEWEPNEIRWYVDDILYHQADPSDLKGKKWVFDKPFFLLLNFAIGGNFGGAIDPANTYPQEYLIDYVKVFQGPDTAERFETSFTDSVAGWQRVTVPFEEFTRSVVQPAGAPDDGLGLKDVWGYGFALPEGGTATGTVRVDLVNVDPKPKPVTVTVTNANDAGEGSLRWALTEVAEGGTVQFETGLTGKTIALTAPLVPTYEVTIDGAAAPGISLDGGGDQRVLEVPPGIRVTGKHLMITNGYGWLVGGGVLNNGELTLDHVTVTKNTMATDAGDFWQGGGGIYNGNLASLTLVDSTVADNTARWSGGGIYSFRNTTTTMIRSTISGNTSGDVGGGLRTLGTVSIDNSTISGNTATGWHGGAIFQTDGNVTITNSTIANNVAPDWAASTFFVGQFGGGFVPTLTMANSVVTGNHWYACEKFASGTTGAVVSGGNNVLQDDSCNPIASDKVIADAKLGSLADNGGPTLTHALLPDSPAIDAANAASSPATDQRGYPRVATPDVGSFEFGATP